MGSSSIAIPTRTRLPRQSPRSERLCCFVRKSHTDRSGAALFFTFWVFCRLIRNGPVSERTSPLQGKGVYLFTDHGWGQRRAHRTSEGAHRAALLGTVEQLVL